MTSQLSSTLHEPKQSEMPLIHCSWLITGASSGLGLTTAITALQAGHDVVATARNVSRAKSSHPEIESLGGIWLELDVTWSAAESIVSCAIKEYRVNILVNNAGYALRGVVEDLTIDQARQVLETNYLGTLAVTKGAIPHFRARRNGTIMMISSASGFNGTPSQSQYSATKFAVEGMAESLAGELAPFNVRVMVIEPGMLRTRFQSAVQEVAFSEPYLGTPAHQKALQIAAGHGKQLGDPAKAAKAIVDIASCEGHGETVKNSFRILLGSDAIVRADTKVEQFSRDVSASRDIARSTDFD